MKTIALAILLGLASLTPAAAYDTPKALLEALYSPYQKGPDFDWQSWDETQFRSKTLNALFAKDAKESGGLGRLDFDPYIDGQDYEISKLTIGDAALSGDTAEVVVTFSNFGTPDSVTFELVKEPDGWKVDDVVNKNPDFAYSLKEIMEAPLD